MTKTRLICIGAIIIMLLSGIIVITVLDDVEGPLIYQVDILPVDPEAGDLISIVVYCIDPSGVSGAQLSWSINSENWATEEMSFYACLCMAGGRWKASFGPVSGEDSAEFFVTAYDSSVYRNAADTQTFLLEIAS
ncbi:MAG: hypothetical protein ACE5H4_14095 [Candidatus Thorarchaeota archaeon]